MPSTLQLERASDRLDLVAEPVAAFLTTLPLAAASEIYVAEIDPDLADTAAFCAEYSVPLDESANCVLLAGRRDGQDRFAACMVLASTRADVNSTARRFLDVRKLSFARQDVAVAQTGMEYGGITPLGLPAGWPVLVDQAVADAERVVIGSGLRRSKLFVPGGLLATVPGAAVLDRLGLPPG